AHCLSNCRRFAASSDQENSEGLRGVVAKVNRRSGIAINAVFARIGDDSHDACRGQVHRHAADSEMAPDAGGSADVPVREASVYHQLARGTMERLTANLASNHRQLHRLKVARRNDSALGKDGLPAGVTFFRHLEFLLILVRYAWRRD